MVFELIGVVAPAQPPLAWTWRQPLAHVESNTGIAVPLNDARAAAQRDLLYPEDLDRDDLGDDWMGDIDPTDGEPLGAK